MNQLPFGTVPKAFKRVKSVRLYLSGENGESTNYDVVFYLRSSGDPVFAVAPPAQWSNAWINHADNRDQFRGGVRISEGLLTGPSFESVQVALTELSQHYAQHIKTLSMKPVIVLALEINVPGLRVNAPHFSGSDHLVGIKAERGFDINGRIYTSYEHHPWNPVGMSLHDLHVASIDKSVRIPYSEAAWATVLQLEETLVRAGNMLAKLGDKDTVQALLEGGMAGLLEGPKS